MIRLDRSCGFVLHRRDKDSRDHHLVCRVRWNCSQAVVCFNLGFVVDPEKWDGKMQACMPRTFHGRARIPAQVINNEMNRYRKATEDVFTRFAESDVWPSPDQVRKTLRVELGLDPPERLSTEDAWARFMVSESIKRSWSDGTATKLRVVKGHVLGFQPFRTLDGFTEYNLGLYVRHLREDVGHNDVTIHRQLGYLRWFLKWCLDNKLTTCTDFVRFRPKMKQPARPVIFLTWEELMRVWDYRAPETRPYLDDVRDVFLFSCFTSLRYSDTQQLTWTDVHGDHIDVVAKKTAKPLTIELNEWSEEILARHIDRAHGKDRVLPQIPNQVMNRYLKDIMRDCGIDEPVKITTYHGAERTDEVFPKWQLIGTHAGRRTFICNALVMGISPSIVMTWTGHSDYKAMKPYIAIADSAKAEAMAVFNRKR